MYCSKCGEIIDDEAVVCPKCGCKTANFDKEDKKNIIINNNASSSSTSTGPTKRKKKYNLILDIILIIFTCGLWFFWMLIRPKYEY